MRVGAVRQTVELDGGDGGGDDLAADDPFQLGGVPRAATRPWSSTTMWSASRSASSRYWVVSTTVVPVVGEFVDDVPQRGAGGRVEPGGRLVEEQHRRRADEAGGEVDAAAGAARQLSDAPAGEVVQGRAVRSARRPARVRRRRRPARRPMSSRFSRPVRNSSSPAYWPVTPIRRRTWWRVGDDVEAVDSARPALGRTRVVRTRISVVLPAPLWPSTPSVEPGSDFDVDAVERPRSCRRRRAGPRRAARHSSRVIPPIRRRNTTPARVDVVVQHVALIGAGRVARVVGEDGVELPRAQRDVGSIDPHLVLDRVHSSDPPRSCVWRRPVAGWNRAAAAAITSAADANFDAQDGSAASAPRGFSNSTSLSGGSAISKFA